MAVFFILAAMYCPISVIIAPAVELPMISDIPSSMSFRASGFKVVGVGIGPLRLERPRLLIVKGDQV